MKKAVKVIDECAFLLIVKFYEYFKKYYNRRGIMTTNQWALNRTSEHLCKCWYIMTIKCICSFLLCYVMFCSIIFCSDN